MKVQVTKDTVSSVLDQIKALTKQQVLVGIPDEKAPRNEAEDDAQKGEPINNAAIGYLMEFGAPAANIPERPHLRPGIEAATDKIAGQLKKGAKAALAGEKDAADVALNAVGLTATLSVKNLITAGISPALSERTLQARRARGRTGETPLIDTGQYRNAVTYVVRAKEK